MEVIDKILNEWSFRCHDGIVDMNDPKKIAILNEILGEYNVDLDERGQSKKIKEPEIEPEKDTIDYYLWVLKNEANIKDQSILDEIKEIYIHNNDASNFKNNFRKYNIKDIDKVFSIFKNYVDVGSKKRGVGKGEFVVILGVADSKSGGTAGKDIAVGKDEKDKEGNIIKPRDIYDVKELTKAGDLRTGSSGYITNSKFQLNYSYLMSLLVAIDENNKNEKEVFGIKKEIRDLVNYFNEKYKKGNISGGILENLRKLLLDLKEYKFEDKDVNNISYIKINGKKYEISNINKDESGNPISITLGPEVKEQKALIIKLRNHPWVKNPQELDIEFNNLWVDYLKDIKGLVIYDNNNLKFYTSDQLKKEFYPYRVVQNQISVIRKGTPPPKDEIEE
jgi:hypothetical protein